MSINLNKNFEDTFVIGDVHGCGKEFIDLIEKIRSESSTATIIQVGDLIDRGPDLIEVLNICDQHGVYATMGNHELNFLQEITGFKPCRSEARKVNIIKYHQYSDDDKAFVKQFLQRLANNIVVRDGEKKALVAHNIPHSQGLRFLSASNAWNFSTNGDNDDIMQDDPQLADYERLIHGHMHWRYEDVSPWINTDKKVINVDSGCVYGKMLTAVNISMTKMFQVQAYETYAEERPPSEFA